MASFNKLATITMTISTFLSTVMHFYLELWLRVGWDILRDRAEICLMLVIVLAGELSAHGINR